MRIRLVNRTDEPLSAHCEEASERKIRFAFTRYSTTIAEIELRFADDNGPKGGVDQRARIRITPRSGKPTVVSAVAEDRLAAMAFAVERAERAFARRLRRERNFDRESIRHLEVSSGQESSAAE